MLAVALPQDSALDPDERYLLVEVAADLGVALHRLDLQEHRRAAEEELGLTACALSASEERHRRLLERLRLHSLTLNQIQDLVAMTDLDGTITFVNDATCRALNLPREELLGRDVRKLDVTPADSAIDPDGIVRRTLATGFWRGRIISRGNDPREIILDCRTHVVRDEANTPVALCSISTDITEQLALEAQLHQSQKLESVGRLAGGVAHDFNNMLGVILGHAEMALQRAALHPKLRHSLETIGKAAERSADLTRQLLAFARKQTIHPRALDLDDAVASMFKMLQRLIGEEIELKFRPQGELWPVRIDPSQVDQILANLCVNARDAIPGHGRIVIATANRPADLDNGGAEAVELTITDDGCGMDAATGEHIFEPFFTTKEVGAGTGLGLSTVYGIVQQNDGEITFVSEPDQGSTFTIRLPRTREVAAPAGDGLATAATDDGETILLVEDERRRFLEAIRLVEDEPGMLSTTRAMLEDLGYAVLTAAGPEEALRRAAGHPGFIDLLLTDVIMPGMHGSQLAARLVDRQPGLPVLYMSGHPADTIAHQGVLDPDLHFLSKPFTRTGLARTVRSILAGA